MSNPKDLQGWKAHLSLGFKGSASKTILASRSQSGPLTVQRPFYPEGNVCHLYLLHPPGGVVGGDELQISINLKEKAKVLITTPGATKFYRSGSTRKYGKLATQNQSLRVAKDCALEWFPQENIFFDKTHSKLVTRVALEGNAQFMGWEINCYGRPASKESFENGKVISRFELYRDGKPLILDGLVVENQTTEKRTNKGTNKGAIKATSKAISSATSLNGYPCFGTFIATQATPELLEKARNAVADMQGDCHIGLTLMDDILVARCLGQYAEQISTRLKLIWMALRLDILGQDACHPRIWST